MHTVSKTASVQFSSVTQSCPTLCDTPGLPVHDQHARTPCPWPTTKVCSSSCPFSDAIQPPHPLSSSPLLPSIFPSIRVFSNESVLQIRWPKYWSFSLNTVTKQYLVRVYYAYKSSPWTGRFEIQRLMWNARAWSYKMAYGDYIGFSDGRGLV